MLGRSAGHFGLRAQVEVTEAGNAQNTVTNFDPASTNRRAVSAAWPKIVMP
jgi:hypothetical protein